MSTDHTPLNFEDMEIRITEIDASKTCHPLEGETEGAYEERLAAVRGQIAFMARSFQGGRYIQLRSRVGPPEVAERLYTEMFQRLGQALWDEAVSKSGGAK